MECEPSGSAPSPASAAEFQHTPLNLQRTQLRLVQIKSTDGPDIECEIERFTYDPETKERLPPYWALSYVWGPETPTQNILLNGKRYTIRQNLYDYLEEQRSQQVADDGKHRDVRCDRPQKTLWFWIDQICIDQNSVDERNHQVRLMARIYQAALGVFVWLGHDDDRKAEMGMRLFQELLTPMYCDLSPFLELPVSVPRGNANIARWVLNNGAPRLTPEAVKSIRSIFENPFWTRIWIIQEVLLGRQTFIQCGKLCFHISAMLLFEVYHLGGSSQSLPTAPEVAMLAPQTRSTWIRPRDLEWMLSEFAEFGCADPRDKVYGLLGVIERGTTIPIDYRKTTQEVFVDVVMSFTYTWSVTKYKDEEEKHKRMVSGTQTLIRLAREMIPDTMEKFFETLEEENGEKRWRFRLEKLQDWWVEAGGLNAGTGEKSVVVDLSLM